MHNDESATRQELLYCYSWRHGSVGWCPHGQQATSPQTKPEKTPRDVVIEHGTASEQWRPKADLEKTRCDFVMHTAITKPTRPLHTSNNAICCATSYYPFNMLEEQLVQQHDVCVQYAGETKVDTIFARAIRRDSAPSYRTSIHTEQIQQCIVQGCGALGLPYRHLARNRRTRFHWVQSNKLA